MIQGSSYPYLPTNYFKGWMQNYVFGMSRLQRHKRAK
jgi:hypothetical protein